MLTFPRIRPITNQADIKALVEAAQADDHRAILPTHLVTKGTEIVGYCSLCVSPTFHVWMHSKRMSPRESFHTINAIENIAASDPMVIRAGGKVIVPCATKSPFNPIMQSMGYIPILETVLHAKQL